MNHLRTRMENRRTWLTTCLRGAACAGVAGTIGLLAARGQVRSCPRLDQRCGDCPDLVACALPPAAVTRRHSAQKGGR
ncbi:MAG: hypothetical protein MUF48_06650 [Pirellulaceae bacterium]|nr:hypothetical protein [Pirellulaceae bacterium]